MLQHRCDVAAVPHRLQAWELSDHMTDDHLVLGPLCSALPQQAVGVVEATVRILPGPGGAL